jgi:hypothetical protein
MFAAVFIPALVGALASMMASFVGRAILALGIGFVTYNGVTFLLNNLKNQVINSIGGLAGDALSLIGFFSLDKGISIIFSAYTIVITMRLVNGSMKKMVFK